MERIKTVGIRELKNKLSAYVHDVKLGWRVLVSDRNRVVAELRAPLLSDHPHKDSPLVMAWAQEGKVLLPTRPKGPYPSPLVHLPGGTSLKLLDLERGE